MYWHIQGLNVRLSNALIAHAERKIKLPLEHAARQVRAVDVRIVDHEVGAPSPCSAQATITLPTGAVVTVRQTDDDFYNCLDRLAHRIRSAVTRRVERVQSKRRHH